MNSIGFSKIGSHIDSGFQLNETVLKSSGGLFEGRSSLDFFSKSDFFSGLKPKQDPDKSSLSFLRGRLSEDAKPVMNFPDFTNHLKFDSISRPELTTQTKEPEQILIQDQIQELKEILPKNDLKQEKKTESKDDSQISSKALQEEKNKIKHFTPKVQPIKKININKEEVAKKIEVSVNDKENIKIFEKHSENKPVKRRVEISDANLKKPDAFLLSARRKKPKNPFKVETGEDSCIDLNLEKIIELKKQVEVKQQVNFEVVAASENMKKQVEEFLPGKILELSKCYLRNLDMINLVLGSEVEEVREIVDLVIEAMDYFEMRD